MTDNLGFGLEKRRAGNLAILAGQETFRYEAVQSDLRFVLIFGDRDGFKLMLDSVVANGHTFEECKEVLKQSKPRVIRSLHDLRITIALSDIILDVGFRNFYDFCKSRDIPVVIISRYISILPLPSPIIIQTLFITQIFSYLFLAAWHRSSVLCSRSSLEMKRQAILKLLLMKLKFTMMELGK